LNGHLSVGIVMPALNEEGVIGATLASIPRDLVDVIWVADNGSSDDTAEEAADHGAHVVSEPRRGYGAACQAALREMGRAAPPDVVVFFDADGSEPIDELRRLLGPISDDQADFVIGVRRFGDTPAHVSVGNRIACFMLGRLSGYRFHDLGPFRAIRFDSLRRLALADPDYGWNVEMQARAVGTGLRIAEVPVSHRPRQAGRSKISGSPVGTLRAGSKIIWTSLREGWRAGRARRRHGPT
jgi:glycosyltransferase involved in cell wall biosynthesis